MSSMTNSTFIGKVVYQSQQVLSSAQTEISVFLIAFAFHAIFFGKLRIHRKPLKQMSTKSMPVKAKQATSSPHSDTVQAKAASRSYHAKELARCSGRLCEMNDAAKVTEELAAKMRSISAKDTVDALAGLLESAGRSSTPHLLAAVEDVLRERGKRPNLELGELILRSYFGLRLMEDFNRLLLELEAAHGSVPSLAILALKASLKASNFQESVDRFAALKPMMTKDALSPGMTQWVSQLVKLAVQEKALPELLQRLQNLNVLAGALDALLVECIQSGSLSDVEEVLSLAREQNFKLGDAAYAALIKASKTPEESTHLFTEAIGQIPQSKEILKAASEWAWNHENEPLLNMVLQKLGSNFPLSSLEVVGNIFRYHYKTKPETEADAIVLQMHQEKFQTLDLSADRDVLSFVAMAAVRRNSESLKCLLESLGESGYVALLKIFAKEKQLEAALSVLKASPTQSASIMNTGMEVCISCNRMEDAQQIMERASKSGLADAMTYNTMAKGLLKNSRMRDAHKVLDAMRAAGFHSNVSTFNEFLDAVVKTGMDNAWQVLEDMHSFNVQPNKITMTILLKAVQARTKAAELDRVLKLIDHIDEELDEVLFNSIVDACIRAGQPELLIPVLKKQKLSAKITSKGAHTYGNVIRAYGYVGDLASVWDTWREMATRHIAPNAVNLGCMVEALVTNGEVEGGYELINQMLKDEQWRPLVNAVIYCSVLKGFSHQKRFDRLWTVYKEMLGLNLQFSIVTFNTLVDACSRNGEMSRISALLQDMIAQGIQPNIITYGAVLKGYCQENRIEEAFSVVEGMLKSTNLRPDEIMFNTLLDGCARQGLYSKGIHVLEDMERSGVPPTNYTLSVLVKLASRSKKLEKAFELCSDVSTKYKFKLNVHVYSNLINACIVNRNLNRAFEVFEKMLSERVRPDPRGYMLLLRECVKGGRPKDAAALLRAATGISITNHSLAKCDARLMQPQGGLSSELITEILEGVAGQCRNEQLAVEVLHELHSTRVRLDPKLQFRIAASALRG